MAEKAYTYVGIYSSIIDAELDFQNFKELGREQLAHIYDMAVVTKDDNGNAVIADRSPKHELQGAASGALIGALTGMAWGPAAMAGNAEIDSAVGRLQGRLQERFSSADAKKLSDALREGQAALVVIGDVELEPLVEIAMGRATRWVEAPMNADYSQLAASAKQM